MEGFLSIFGYHPHHQTKATLHPFARFSGDADAKEIHEILKAGDANKHKYDDAALFKILCSRTNSQRQEIKKSYRTLFQEDLTQKLKAAFKGIDEAIFIAILAPTDEYDALELYGSMKGIGTKEATIIEIMCSRTNEEIRDAIMAYRHLYGKNLVDDIRGDTSGDFETLLIDLCKGGRDEGHSTDRSKAKQDADALYRAGEKKWGTDEATFFKILTTENFSQLQDVFREYNSLSGHEIEVAIKKEFSGDVYTGLIAIVKVVKNRPAYFAEKIHEAVESKNYKDLLRLVVSRCEKDMFYICEEFKRLYKTELDSFIRGIKDKTADSVKDVLIPLIIGNQ